MYYLANFKKSKEKKKNVAKEVGIIAGSGLVAQRALRSGLPRALGVRLESHSTSKDTAKKILESGGYLDPNYGGKGAAKLDPYFVQQSKKYVHLTGKHPDSKVKPGEGKKLLDKFRNAFPRKYQRSLYRGLADVDLQGATLSKNPKEVKKIVNDNLLAGALGLKGRTLYTGGSDEFFKNNFIPDPDDIALKSDKAVKVFGSRAAATKAAIDREGLLKLMKSNPKRVAKGLAILGIGGLAGKAAIDSVNRLRSNPNEKVKVKGFLRKGKPVSGFFRKKKKK